ncbi:hypothetical protein SSIG_04242 [Streptomyces filamentosus NRRL 11379]|uniref:Predicted protein n=1 Tax=Streptomyces filamentosus NRRL 15998 TaxID=457431 RepID=D6ADI4_STRFL|nr:predicted protein [Streptomyces filamentosus NRRL 15998]EWS93640.1 hypothetical protein SSIG_04242 [Streptomyces filamentosus NRRL 11379]
MVGKQGVSRLLRLGRLPAGLALLASAGLLATGCGGKTGCGSGAESGEDAVRQFLSAAARDDSDEDVCRYLQEGENVDEAVTWVSGLGTSGDVDTLDVREVRGDQMGAEHRFVLGPSSAPIADLAVIESDGRFVVSVTGSTKK